MGPQVLAGSSPPGYSLSTGPPLPVGMEPILGCGDGVLTSTLLRTCHLTVSTGTMPQGGDRWGSSQTAAERRGSRGPWGQSALREGAGLGWSRPPGAGGQPAPGATQVFCLPCLHSFP